MIKVIKVLRSLLFIPSISKKMLDKINILEPDAFVLDLEDSVPVEEKQQARENVRNKLLNYDSNRQIFIRINDLKSVIAFEDIDKTLDLNFSGYIVPKFESIKDLEKLNIYISKKELLLKKKLNSLKLILMVETPLGFLELERLKDSNSLEERIIALAIGWEDFTRSLTVFGNISEDFLNFVRNFLVIYSRAYNLFAIDTVFKNFSDDEGLKADTERAAMLGFNGKLAIHPRQIDVINKCFTPSDDEIAQVNKILSNRKKIEKDGAINIDGVMYDPPHLKWAAKINDYLKEIKKYG
ncbi:MAG: CoA ester lyase [Cyanobacteria bacterium]|nr:CoA ester lyase [Cyanobacteriota bacterium]